MPPIRFTSEPAIPSRELLDDMQAAASPSLGYYLMLAFSAVLATLGLVADSMAVIIGAMIIAPLMNPIMATAYAFTRGNRDLWIQAVFTLLTGVILVISVSVAVVLAFDYQAQGREIFSRANPNLLDLGVAVGSGLAGAYAWSHRRIGNALPGVAISVALVPPLCVVGIGLTVGDRGLLDPALLDASLLSSIEIGASLLFLTNLVAILLAGSLVFLLQGYGSWNRARTGVLFSVAMVAMISVPLAFSFGRIQFRNSLMRTLKEVSESHPEWSAARLAGFSVDHDQDPVVFRLRVEAPPGLIGMDDVVAIETSIEERIDEDVTVEITVIEFTTLSSGDRAGSRASSAPISDVPE